MKVITAALVTVLLTLGLGACGGLEPEPPHAENGSASQDQTAGGMAFDIANFTLPSLVVQPGTTVTWTNRDAASHTATSGTPGVADGIWDSDRLTTNDGFSFSFESEGTFPYFCTIHPGSMSGVITVASAESYGLVESSGPGPDLDY